MRNKQCKEESDDLEMWNPKLQNHDKAIVLKDSFRRTLFKLLSLFFTVEQILF